MNITGVTNETVKNKHSCGAFLGGISPRIHIISYSEPRGPGLCSATTFHMKGSVQTGSQGTVNRKASLGPRQKKD